MSNTRMPVVDATQVSGDFTPVCPHCKHAIGSVIKQQLNEGLGKAYLWACGNCRSVLGVSHRKGFWMG